MLNATSSGGLIYWIMPTIMRCVPSVDLEGQLNSIVNGASVYPTSCASASVLSSAVFLQTTAQSPYLTPSNTQPHSPSYSSPRHSEQGTFRVLITFGMGSIIFSDSGEPKRRFYIASFNRIPPGFSQPASIPSIRSGGILATIGVLSSCVQERRNRRKS